MRPAPPQFHNHPLNLDTDLSSKLCWPNTKIFQNNLEFGKPNFHRNIQPIIYIENQLEYQVKIIE